MSDGSLIIQGTAISAVAPEADSYRITYQLEDGTIRQKDESSNIVAISGSSDPSPPLGSSPLATVSWNDGEQVRVYFLDSGYTIGELRYTQGEGWRRGNVFVRGIKVAPGAGLAAAVAKFDDRPQIHLFYQELYNRIVVELIDYDGNDNWTSGSLYLGDTLADTKLAAVAYFSEARLHVHLFYQSAKLLVKEHYFNGDDWGSGGFNPSGSSAPSRCPIAATTFVSNQLPQVQVYWHSRTGMINFAQRNGNLWGDPQDTGIVGVATSFL